VKGQTDHEQGRRRPAKPQATKLCEMAGESKNFHGRGRGGGQQQVAFDFTLPAGLNIRI